MSKKERKQLESANLKAHSYNRLDAVKEWLHQNYEVRVNLLDRSKVYLNPTNDCSFEYKHPVTEDDVMLHAYAEEINVPRALLKMLLASPNQMQSFNPVHDYLNALRGKYKGPSQIDLLCASLHFPEDIASKEYAERASRLIRKWLVATVACALGTRQNDVALGLIGEKAGIGKTTFFEQMVPPQLKEYYQVAQKDDRLFQMHTSFAQRFILNFDEFAAITKTNEQVFKQMMSAAEVSIKRPGFHYVENVPRGASVCFTSNKNHRMGGFIRIPDSGMLRRLAVIEVDAIEDYRQQLNVDQLWAEAVMLLDGGFDPVWSQQEYQQFVEENRQYVVESNALRLLRLYYRMPQNDEESAFMSAMEIVHQLKEKRKVSSAQQEINEVTVGMALSMMGFKSRSARNKDGQPRYGYDIVPMFDKPEVTKE